MLYEKIKIIIQRYYYWNTPIFFKAFF